MNTDTTIELVSLALDASLMRQTAIANNIANTNTQGYKTIEVNFEQQLNETGYFSLSGTDAQGLEQGLSIHPFYQLSDQQSTVDQQMALNVQNMTHYRALIKGLNQKFAIMKLALQGNN